MGQCSEVGYAAVMCGRLPNSPAPVVDDPFKLPVADLGAYDALCGKGGVGIVIDVKEEQIKLLCKQLKLPTFSNYRDVLWQSRADADFSDLLLDLLMAETNARQENQNRRRLKAAGSPFQKTLDEFDFTWMNPSISPVFIHELASCKFMDDRKNVVMIGNPCRGKTHISIAIGLKACLQGYRVLFKNAGTLATELTEARDAYQLGRIERQLEKTDLLILDELSYMSFTNMSQNCC